MASSWTRLETSKKRLQIRWDYPVPIGEEVLDLKSVLKEIRGRDPRPLIVLRDCDSCKGKDDALLSRTLGNEKTLLLTQWFHCIKLDRRVLEKSHPYHILFSGEKPPHLFLMSWDGSIRMDLNGKQSQKKLWMSMRKVLKADYKKDALVAARNWLRILDRFDIFDSQEKNLSTQLDRLLGKKGKAKKIKALEAKLAKLKKEREAAFKKEQDLINLILKHAPKKRTVADFDAESADEVKASGGGGLLDKIRKGKGEAKNASGTKPKGALGTGH